MNNIPHIFLDIDGVLALEQQFNSKKRHEEWNCYRFDMKCVKLFNKIIEETGAVIVLSSDWKYHYDLATMNNIFKWCGVVKSLEAFTCSFYGTKFFNLNDLEACRAEEIKQYVEINEITCWVAIDDLDLSPYIDDDNFVICPRVFEGIKQCGVKGKIINRLKEQQINIVIDLLSIKKKK